MGQGRSIADVMPLLFGEALQEFHRFRQQVVQERHIIALRVTHCAAHAGETLAETQIIGWIVFGRLAF